MYDEIFNDEEMIKLQNLLRTHNKTITAAESCTGVSCKYDYKNFWFIRYIQWKHSYIFK